MDLDPMRLKQPLWGFPVHVPITCDSAGALPLLADMMERHLTPARRGVIRERKKALEQAHRAARIRRARDIRRASRAFPLSPAWVRECVNRVSDANTVLLWDIAAIGQGDRTVPGHVFAQYAANLGSSWPRAVGVKMAAPEKTVISSGGDGCTLFANPEAVLWTARKYDAPVLYIVNNNHRYQAVAENLEAYGGDESHAGRAGYNGASLSPSPDFAAVARAMGAYGETVTRPEQMEGSLGRALAALKEGRSAILDTVTVKPEPSS
jgi:acetolactate synthase-1/2/3 large subunit